MGQLNRFFNGIANKTVRVFDHLRRGWKIPQGKPPNFTREKSADFSALVSVAARNKDVQSLIAGYCGCSNRKDVGRLLSVKLKATQH